MATTAADAGRQDRLVLSRSMPLRMLTLVLLYFTQGFPLGLFFYAIPAWMAANGVGAAGIAAVVAAAALPWSLKIANGFILDRYAFLPMGRRRAWIIGAQAVLVLALAAGALFEPAARDIMALTLLGFITNLAINFQDVGIDSLAIDIMPEDERARAGGIMCGAQFVGLGTTAAVAGWLLQHQGIAVCLAAVTLIPAFVMLYAILIRERAGERRLPWTDGQSHPHNLGLTVDAWWPLLRRATLAVLAPTSLLLVPALFVRSMPAGAAESFSPVLFQTYGGWTLSDYTNLVSTLTLAGGILSLLVLGYLVEKAGAQRTLAFALLGGAIVLAAMGFAKPYWGDPRVLVGFAATMVLLEMLYFVAALALAMHMCTPAIAATQFTIYMAVSNFGRPTGAMLAAYTAGAGHPEWLYWSLAAIWALVFPIALKAPYPGAHRMRAEG